MDTVDPPTAFILPTGVREYKALVRRYTVKGLINFPSAHLQASRVLLPRDTRHVQPDGALMALHLLFNIPGASISWAWE